MQGASDLVLRQGRADEHSYGTGDDVRPDALCIGDEDRRDRGFSGIRIFSVFNDANDFQSDGVEEFEALSHSVAGAEEEAGEGLIHDGDGGRSKLVVRGEIASVEEMCSGNLEITWRGGVINCAEGGVGRHKLGGVPGGVELAQPEAPRKGT